MSTKESRTTLCESGNPRDNKKPRLDQAQDTCYLPASKKKKALSFDQCLPNKSCRFGAERSIRLSIDDELADEASFGDLRYPAN